MQTTLRTPAKASSLLFALALGLACTLAVNPERPTGFASALAKNGGGGNGGGNGGNGGGNGGNGGGHGGGGGNHGGGNGGGHGGGGGNHGGGNGGSNQGGHEKSGSNKGARSRTSQPISSEIATVDTSTSWTKKKSKLAKGNGSVASQLGALNAAHASARAFA